jgi:hypothetical protein
MTKTLPWYKRNPEDWRRGTRKHAMSLELRGFYSEFIDAMWEMQGELPKCPKALAMMLGTNPRKVRALLPQLIALGKVMEGENGYSNPRMLNDIQGRVEVVSSSTGDRVDIDLISKVTKNPMISTRDLDLDLEIERERENTSVPLSQNPEPKAVDGRTDDSPSDYLKEVFNGQTEAMLVFTETAMGGFCRPNAVQWLSTTVAAHGSDAVAQAFASMIEKRAAGEIITRPLPLWSNIAAGIKRGHRNANAAAKRQSIETTPKPKGVAEVLRERRAAAEKAAAEVTP